MNVIPSIENILWEYKKPGPYSVNSFTQELTELKADLPANGAKYMISYTTGEKRYSCKTGRFIRKFFGEWFDDQGILNAGKEINAELWAAAAEVKLLSGEDIRDFYNDANSGIESCMSHDHCGPYLDIYVHNPDAIQLATFKSGTKHAARALVWTIDGIRYMDKTYYTSDLAYQALKTWRKENNLKPKDDLWDGSGVSVELSLNPDIDIAEHLFPYTDSFIHMDIIDEGHIKLSTKSESKFYLESTSGGPHIMKCKECGDITGTYDSYKDSYYCRDCFNKLFIKCGYCGKAVPKSDIKKHGSSLYCDKCDELMTKAEAKIKADKPDPAPEMVSVPHIPMGLTWSSYFLDLPAPVMPVTADPAPYGHDEEDFVAYS